MTPVSRFELVLILMAVVVVLELLARRLRMPPAAAFILGGIALALIPGTPNVEIDPDLVLVLFLPPLLLSGAYFTVWRDFRANLRIILGLAIGAVTFTTAAVGVVAHWIEPNLPWAACFALGAIVSPPDAVSAKAVLQRVSLPPRVTLLLEGESLVNDATGLVLYRFAVVAALTGAFSAGNAVLSFGGLALGGVALGLAFGWVVSAVLMRMRDPTLSVIASFLVAWVSYIVGDWLHVSGVLTTVACGVVMGTRQHRILSAATRSQASAVWQVVVFVLESLIFILIGLSLRSVAQRLGGDWHAFATLAPAVWAIIATVIVSRFVWILPATYIPRALSPSLRKRDPYPPLAVPIVMGWAGMRGVVSLAAALALPEGFPGRDFILAATFAVILVTVLVQGATLAPLIRLLRLGSFKQKQATDTLSEHQARARMVAAQLAEVERLSAGEDQAQAQRHPRLVEQYSYRARVATRFSEAAESLTEHRREHFKVVLAAVAAGRAEILKLHHAGSIHDRVLNVLEHDLDLEETAARQYLGEPEGAG